MRKTGRQRKEKGRGYRRKLTDLDDPAPPLRRVGVRLTDLNPDLGSLTDYPPRSFTPTRGPTHLRRNNGLHPPPPSIPSVPDSEEL